MTQTFQTQTIDTLTNPRKDLAFIPMNLCVATTTVTTIVPVTVEVLEGPEGRVEEVASKMTLGIYVWTPLTGQLTDVMVLSIQEKLS
jgi:hypothetical protein